MIVSGLPEEDPRVPEHLGTAGVFERAPAIRLLVKGQDGVDPFVSGKGFSLLDVAVAGLGVGGRDPE